MPVKKKWNAGRRKAARDVVKYTNRMIQMADGILGEQGVNLGLSHEAKLPQEEIDLIPQELVFARSHLRKAALAIKMWMQSEPK
jgi:hypothetical protein